MEGDGKILFAIMATWERKKSRQGRREIRHNNVGKEEAMGNPLTCYETGDTCTGEVDGGYTMLKGVKLDWGE